MANIPANIIELINKPQAAVKVLVSANKDGVPHAIVAGSIISPAPDTMVVGEVLMKKTAKNLAENKRASFLISAGMEAYEIDCAVKARLDKGPELDEMNKNLAAVHLKANAIWIFSVCAVYDEGASPKAGTKLA